jgi:DNA-binding NarL/FixJ family response regulator
VLIVSETRLYREGLAETLARDGTLDICGHSASAQAAMAALVELEPDVVLLDAAARDGPGLAAAMATAAPGMQVVVMALAEAPDDVLNWAAAGAAGYIPQTTSLAEVGPTVLEIVDGAQACAPRVASALMRRLRELSEAAARRPNEFGVATLTARELQIARLINTGLSNKQIARQLGVGLATIKSHVHSLLGKLEIERRGQVMGRLGSGLQGQGPGGSEFWTKAAAREPSIRPS